MNSACWQDCVVESESDWRCEVPFANEEDHDHDKWEVIYDAGPRAVEKIFIVSVLIIVFTTLLVLPH